MSNIDLAVSCTKWPTQPAGAYPYFYSVKQQEELLPLLPFPPGWDGSLLESHPSAFLYSSLWDHGLPIFTAG